jgi:hypothetical protein
VYRDVLHGAGVVDVLRSALTDASVLADLQLLQVRRRQQQQLFQKACAMLRLKNVCTCWVSAVLADLQLLQVRRQRLQQRL